MIKSKLKSGFTLIELMVFFVFISILLAASTPIITKRVKNLPLKVYHGKYMCYRRDDGSLVEEYYNASIRVSGPTVVADNACHFNPPKKATVYKIEMIGAGAGGYEYYGEPGNEHKVESEDRSGEYRIGYGMSYTDSKYHEVPDGAQLKRIFRNAQFRYVSANVGRGGAGANVNIGYAPLGIKSSSINYYLDPEFKLTEEYQYLENFKNKECDAADTEEQRKACEGDKQAVNNANDLITQMKKVLSSNLGIYYKLYAGNSNTAQINEKLYPYRTLHTSVATVKETIYGKQGGRGGYLQYNGIIDFVDYSKTPFKLVNIDSIDAYLKALPEHIVSGSLPRPANVLNCKDWSPTQPDSGRDATVQELRGLDSDVLSAGCQDGSDPRCKGGDVERYGALKLWNRWCISNEIRATGGEGAWANLNGKSEPQHISYSNSSDLESGTDASGVVRDKSIGLGDGHSFTFSHDGNGSAWPSLIIKTYLHNVTHTVGLNGTSGQVKTVFESNLRDDCEFNVPAGGRVIKDTYTNDAIADEQSKLATTLSCNDHTINHRVEGGRYRKDTFSETKSEFEYMNNPPNYTFETVPPTAGSASQYNPTNVFTRYSLDAHHFGQGGAGSGVVDNCMKPQGYYIHMLKTIDGSISHTEQYGLDEPFTCEMDNPEHFEKIPPTNGSGGAIIISW